MFSLITETDLTELPARAFLYRHECGAELLHIRTEDNNKVFAAAFRTLPSDDTGVFHILEHSVLCGSEKYPIKDPFNELSKGSLQTYLNAMTYSDKTLYPVASTNEKDFFKMAGVYLDAVFAPLVTRKKAILLREGRNFKPAENGVEIGGIVYNEMRGAYSEGDEYLEYEVRRRLFAGTPFMYDSGGFPDAIPGLTHESLIARHAEFYSPRNAFLYLYGDMDADKYLRYIEEEYLQSLPPGRNVPPEITFSPPSEPQYFDLTGNFGRDYACAGLFLSRPNEPELTMRLSLLIKYLFRMTSSPVKLLAEREKIGSDLTCFLDFHMPAYAAFINIKDCGDARGAFSKIRARIAEESGRGFDRRLLRAVLDSSEFDIKERNYGHRPNGLHYLINACPQWLRGGDPFPAFFPKKLFEDAKKFALDGGLEALARELFTENLSLVAGSAIHSENAERAASFDASKLDKAETESDARLLADYANESDDPAALAAIPVLELSDIEKKAEIIPFEADSSGDFITGRVNIPTNGITYMYFMFNAEGLPPEKLETLSYLLGKLDTKNYGFEELSSEIALYLGGFGASPLRFTPENAPFRPEFVIKIKALDQNIGFAFKLLDEILKNTIFTDIERIKTLLTEYASREHSAILEYGHSFAVKRAIAAISPSGAFDELCGGVSFYQYLCGLAETEAAEALCAELENLKVRLFSRANFSFHAAGEADYKGLLAEFYSGLSDSPKTRAPEDLALFPANTAVLTGAKIFHNAAATRLKRPYTGALEVLSSVLDDYFMEEIRAAGGAYGFGSGFTRAGYAYMYSFRDPQRSNTFAVFGRAAEFTRKLSLSERELRSFIIGTISGFDAPKHAEVKTSAAVTRFLSGITPENIQKERDEVLSTTLEKLRQLAEVFEEAPAKCALGGKDGKGWECTVKI
ncbi:MAG: insulinase family protein [Clostridiales bacterium]|jgi:Zn-dependent M16 (insulinase) family peptidase|nr:insulinase family protein [Clostridiales bacterium]